MLRYKMLRHKLTPLFSTLHANQTMLKGACEEFMTKLAQKGNAAAQAKRNAVTDHEAKFAHMAECHGFQYLTSMKKDLPETGDYYVFEPNGSQQSPDFKFVTVDNHTIQEEISVDLKHSLGKNIVLNDGWFEDGIIYVVTYTKGTVTSTFLGLGERIPTPEEKIKMEQLRKIKKELNSVADKNIGNLHTYIRFANSYSCDRFTEEFLEGEWQHLLQWFAAPVAESSASLVKKKRLTRGAVPQPPQVLAEPHSQSEPPSLSASL